MLALLAIELLKINCQVFQEFKTDQNIAGHAIGKNIHYRTMRIERQKIETSSQRRSFFSQAFSGIAGIWILEKLATKIFLRRRVNQYVKNIQAVINPLAVPRTQEKVNPYGE